jgi:hypothetical protein
MTGLLRSVKPVLIFITVLICAYLVLALPGPATLHNITIPVPDGTTLHGDNTLCTTASALDVIIFYLANYFAHAVTVKSYPGESGLAKQLSYIAAFFFPASGVVRGVNALARHGRFAKGALAQAAQSGALCMVVRNDEWEPENGLQLTNIRLRWRVYLWPSMKLIAVFLF